MYCFSKQWHGFTHKMCVYCVCTMDGAKNVTNEHGDSGSKIQVDYIMVEKGATCSHAIGPGSRAAAVARLPRSLLDPELFPHTAYFKILATLARKTVN